MKKLSIIIAVISFLFLAWGFLSWAEIIVKNLTESPTYCPFNLFIFLFK